MTELFMFMLCTFGLGLGVFGYGVGRFAIRVWAEIKNTPRL